MEVAENILLLLLLSTIGFKVSIVSYKHLLIFKVFMMFLKFQKYDPINLRFPRRTTAFALIDKSSAKVVQKLG